MMIVKSKKLILLLSISIVNYNLLECKELKIVSTLSISLEDMVITMSSTYLK